MSRSFTDRVLPVVADKATHAGCKLVVIQIIDNDPRRRNMARGAVARCIYMSAVFTRRLDSIVAGLAARSSGGVIHDRADVEPARRVAGVALRHGEDMSKAFAAGGFAVMAAVALLGQSLEYPVAVARFTGD